MTMLNSFTYYSLSEISLPLTFLIVRREALGVRRKCKTQTAERILLRPSLRDYGGQVAPACAKRLRQALNLIWYGAGR